MVIVALTAYIWTIIEVANCSEKGTLIRTSTGTMEMHRDIFYISSSELNVNTMQKE